MATTLTARGGIEQLELERITPAPRNRTISKEQLQELVESVREHGVLQPVLVRPLNGTLELVFGHRRFLAAKEAGLESIPAIVREMEDVEALEAQLIENCQRQDIHPLEEAEYFERLTKEHRYTVDDIAAKIGKSRSHVYGRLKYAALSAPARKAFWAGDVTPSVALLVARVPESLQKDALRDVTHRYREKLETPMSFREASEVLQRNYMLRLHDAAFSKTDAELVPAAGACSSCPKRTGNQRELFDDVKSADVCTDPKCFREKMDAHWAQLKAKASENGTVVLSDNEAKKVFPPNYYNGHISHSAGYVELEDSCHDVPYGSKLWGKPFRHVLKEPLKSGEVAKVIARDQDGRIRTLIAEKDAKAALRRLGLTKSMTSGTTDAYQARQRNAAKKAKRRKKAAALAIERIAAEVSATPQKTTGAEFWKLMVEMVRRSTGSLAEKRVTLTGRTTEAQLKAAALELFLHDSAEMAISAWNTIPYPSDLRHAAEHFGVDLKAIEREVTAAEPKPKKTRPKKAK